MIITGATQTQLEDALEEANRRFDWNLRWNRFEALSATRFHVTLRVEDSRRPGHRWGRSGRRLVAACWHAHGRFFDALPKGAVIRASGRVIRPGDPWEDRNIGSIIFPMYYSEACEC